MTTVGSRHAVAPAASTAASRKPSSAGYRVAAVVALAGLLGAVLWAALGALGAVTAPDDLARAALPANVTAEVTEPGTLVVYYEGDPVPSLAQLDVEVAGPGGPLVQVSDVGYDLRYDSPTEPGGVGTAVATFEAAEPGQYAITSRYDPRGLAHLAVGENIGADFVQRMLGPVLLAAGTLLVAVVVALSTVTRRSRR